MPNHAPTDISLTKFEWIRPISVKSPSGETFSINGNDILNQNVTLDRLVTANVVTDYYTNIISRYFLLKLTYKFNNNGTKEEDYKRW